MLTTSNLREVCVILLVQAEGKWDDQRLMGRCGPVAGDRGGDEPRTEHAERVTDVILRHFP